MKKEKRIKILLSALLVTIVVAGVALMSSAELLEGRMKFMKRAYKNPIPASHDVGQGKWSVQKTPGSDFEPQYASSVATMKNPIHAQLKNLFDKNAVTRCEVAVAFVDAFDLEDKARVPDKFFSDLAMNDECYEPLNLMVKNGVLNGYADGTIHANGTIARAEYAKVLVAASPKISTCTSNNMVFEDVGEMAWYGVYVNGLYYYGVLEGMVGPKFYPEANTTEYFMNETLKKAENAVFSTLRGVECS